MSKVKGMTTARDKPRLPIRDNTEASRRQRRNPIALLLGILMRAVSGPAKVRHEMSPTRRGIVGSGKYRSNSAREKTLRYNMERKLEVKRREKARERRWHRKREVRDG